MADFAWWRLRHRIPVRLRQNHKLVTLCVAFLAACLGVFGSGMIRPYVTTVHVASAETVTTNVAGTKNLFDSSLPHEVKLTFTDEAYEDMLSEYFKDGEKKYVEADLIIDGTRVPSVGVRLKGNSTLTGLTWNGKSRTGGRGGFPGGGQAPAGGFPPPEGFEPPEGFRPPGDGQPQAGQPSASPSGTGRPQDDQPPSRRGNFGFGAQLKAEEPENLPWLIRFDEFVEGRRYQGHSQIAVRPSAMGSTAMLREALGIAMVGAAGEPTQRATYSSFEVNGRVSKPRLIVEYLDEDYAESLGDGVLYKSLATSSFTYKGEDQTQYTNDFKQINKVGGKDLQPVIDLIKWVNEASDAEFAAGLADRVDIDSLARYLVLQNMMVNFDDMAGPGRNYYLWYDQRSRKLTVITWDLNLAFSGDAKQGVHESGRFGFGQVQGDRQPPAGLTPAEGPGQNHGAGGMMRMGHPLKEKFLKVPAFKKVYEEQYRVLYDELLASGTATGLLDDLVASYKQNAAADAAEVDAEAKTLKATLKTRTESLGADSAIRGT